VTLSEAVVIVTLGYRDIGGGGEGWERGDTGEVYRMVIIEACRIR